LLNGRMTSDGNQKVHKQNHTLYRGTLLIHY
jgi:hypothetical protein